jgi:hypothetical protein
MYSTPSNILSSIEKGTYNSLKEGLGYKRFVEILTY